MVNDASFDRTFGRLTAALMAQRQIALFRRLLARQCDNRADLFGRECRRCAGRGASARRCATCVALVELRQRCSRWRTIYGQTPSWRAVSSTPIPAAVSKVIRVTCCLPWRGVRSHKADQRLLMRGGQNDGLGGQTRHRGRGESKDEQVIRHPTPGNA